MNTKPQHEIRLGSVKAAIRRIESEADARINVKLGRIYKDGETLKSSDSFLHDDLLPVSKVAELRRLIRRVCFIGKIFGLLISATVEPFFRTNFCRRQPYAILDGCILLLTCVLFMPKQTFLTLVFLTSLLFWYLYHSILGLQRRRLNLPEPPVRHSGNSWNFWHVLGFSVKTVQCLIEPALCWIAGFGVLRLDLLLGCWLLIAGASLYIKGSRPKIRGFLLAAFDKKFKADLPISSAAEPADDPAPASEKPDDHNIPSA